MVSQFPAYSRGHTFRSVPGFEPFAAIALLALGFFSSTATGEIFKCIEKSTGESVIDAGADTSRFPRECLRGCVKQLD
jgi:hypothetical protein